jgi:hypothetical protein
MGWWTVRQSKLKQRVQTRRLTSGLAGILSLDTAPYSVLTTHLLSTQFPLLIDFLPNLELCLTLHHLAFPPYFFHTSVGRVLLCMVLAVMLAS